MKICRAKEVRHEKSHIRFHLYEIFRIIKSIEVESKFEFFKAAGRRECGVVA